MQIESALHGMRSAFALLLLVGLTIGSTEATSAQDFGQFFKQGEPFPPPATTAAVSPGDS